MPTNIRKKSEIEQIRQTINVNCFFKPCSITNIFWAPIAKIKLRLVKKPNNKNSKLFTILLCLTIDLKLYAFLTPVKI